jgi:hypothetical protein
MYCITLKLRWLMLEIIFWILQFSSKPTRLAHKERNRYEKIILVAIIFSAELFAPMLVQAQGMLYVSNLGQNSSGGVAVGNDSWIAQLFVTGTSSSGYVLNSIQLLMDPASENPSSFTVSLYSPGGNAAPETFLGNLNGSSDPAAGGILTYSATGITLSPLTGYFVVVTASTSVANGAYYWSLADTDLDTTFGDSRWAIYELYGTSPNGSNWTEVAGQNIFQMAIYATAIPEPSAYLIFLGSGVLFYVRRTFHR